MTSHSPPAYLADGPDSACFTGPRGEAFLSAREMRSLWRLLGHWMRDDKGNARCLLCLRVVPDQQLYKDDMSPADAGTEEGKIRGSPVLLTGFECVSCGQEGATR